LHLQTLASLKLTIKEKGSSGPFFLFIGINK
jgi:hypothetical protein